MQGWAIANKCDSENRVVPCRDHGYTPKSIIAHCKSEKQCIYHYVIHHYLSLLYYDNSDEIQCCVSDSYLLMIHPHPVYKELRNW